ncbi:hypothetical protein [Variovorax sp. PvP013]|jgi:hypothetical protein|uniref:hypothetical protein n=1 Tax=Variovorax sp. PvP013 TaxID=3156435 RepID=UPI003D1FA602
MQVLRQMSVLATPLLLLRVQTKMPLPQNSRWMDVRSLGSGEDACLRCGRTNMLCSIELDR